MLCLIFVEVEYFLGGFETFNPAILPREILSNIQPVPIHVTRIEFESSMLKSDEVIRTIC